MEFALKLSEIDSLSELNIFQTALHGLNVGGYLRESSGDLVFLGGRPGSGKTLLAMQIAYDISKSRTVLFFSLEMTAEQLKYRLSKDRTFSSKGSELYVYSAPSISIEKLVEVAHEQHKRTPLDMIFVDYTQIVQAQGRSKAEEVDSVVTELKILAKELGVPIMALAQLNRNIEARENSSEFAEPQMGDFADSASIEKWADCCLILHRIPKSPGLLKVHSVKNRHGQKTVFGLQLNRQTLKFEDNEGEQNE